MVPSTGHVGSVRLDSFVIFLEMTKIIVNQLHGKQMNTKFGSHEFELNYINFILWWRSYMLWHISKMFERIHLLIFRPNKNYLLLYGSSIHISLTFNLQSTVKFTFNVLNCSWPQKETDYMLITWLDFPHRWGWISGCTSSSCWTGWLSFRGSRF